MASALSLPPDLVTWYSESVMPLSYSSWEKRLTISILADLSALI